MIGARYNVPLIAGVNMQEIRSKDNPKVKKAARLKEQKFREQEGLFLIEGKNLCMEAFASGNCQIECVFADAAQEAEYLELYRQYGYLDWIKTDQRIMKHIADTYTPQGIAAVVRLPHPTLEPVLEQNAFLLLLDQISDPGNMGTIWRTAWAFGVDGIMLSPGSVDPFNPKAVRASMGAIFHVPVFRNISCDEIAAIRRRGYKVLVSAPDADCRLAEIDFSGPAVLVIGSEAHGVSRGFCEMSDIQFKIPIITGVDSLNAGVACGIIIHEAGKQRGRIR